MQNSKIPEEVRNWIFFNAFSALKIAETISEFIKNKILKV